MDVPVVHESVPAEKLNAIVANIPVGKLGSAEYVAMPLSYSPRKRLLRARRMLGRERWPLHALTR